MERRRKVRSNKGYVSIFVIEKKLGFFLLIKAAVLFNSLSYWAGSPTKNNRKKTICNLIKVLT